MPLYEYRCRTCQHAFETLVRSWNEAVHCPSCSGEDVDKQLSTFAMAMGGPSFESGGIRPPQTPLARPSGGGCCGGGGCGCH